MFRISFAATALLLSTACQEKAETTPIQKQQREWIELSDGSRYFEQRHEGRVSASARCWTADGSWDCLNLMFDDDGGAHAQRRSLTSLAAFDGTSWPFDSKGYQCRYMQFRPMSWSISERINDAAGAALITNEAFPSEGVRTSGEIWSTDYVERFKGENEIEGGAAFSCYDLWRTMTAGSPATLGTTAVNLNEIDSYGGKNMGDPLAAE